MAKSGRGVERQASHESTGAAQPGEEVGDPFEEWERYPATEAEENIGYQKVAWYAAPFGDTGIALLVLAVVANILGRAGRAAMRLLMR